MMMMKMIQTYKQDSYVVQHVGVVEPVGPVLPLTEHSNTRLLLLQGQIHVVPGHTCSKCTQTAEVQQTLCVETNSDGD